MDRIVRLETREAQHILWTLQLGVLIVCTELPPLVAATELEM